MDEILEWVWWYHDHNFSIIPLGNNKGFWGNSEDELKRPSLKSWDKYKTELATKEVIQQWADDGLFKGIAVICGHVSDNLVVIDIDDATIPETIGLKFDNIIKDGCWVVQTGKGFHIYTKHHSNPGGIKKPLKYKIEYRANNGYVVAPPSIHPNGKKYEFIGIKKPSDLNTLHESDVKEKFNLLKQKIGTAWGIEESKHSMKGTVGVGKPNGYPKCVEAALTKTIGHPMRYYTIYGIVSSFAMQNIPKDMALKRIKEFNMTKCKPPHSNHIIEQAIDGAYQDNAHHYGCEFWMDHADLCQYENIMECPHGRKKAKRELAKQYKVFKYTEQKNDKTGETFYVRSGVTCPNLAELIINEYDLNFITIEDTKEIYYYNDGMYHSKGENIIRNVAEDHMESLTSKHRKNEVEDYIKDKHYINRNKFNPHIHLINLQNGIYNLRSKELNPHNPKHYFINEIPIKYNKDADCQKIKHFLSEVIEKKYIPCIQEFIGYCLYRDYPYHKAFMFLGGGKNGKSTLINLIGAFLGHGNISNKELQHLTYDKFAKSKLFGKLLNAAADISSAALNQTSTFKGLTGGDYTDAEKKFMDSFEFKNYAKLLFSANTLPKTNDDSYAFYRRWVMINFPNTFEGKQCDHHILNKLITPDELSGLFNWAIEGLERLLKNNKFTYSRTVEEIRIQYKTLSDPVFSFVQKFIKTQSSGYLTKEDVYHKFNIWCSENDLPMTPKNMFTLDLGMHVPNMKPGKSRIAGKLTPVYNYIGWKKDEDDEINEKNNTNPEQQNYFS